MSIRALGFTQLIAISACSGGPSPGSPPPVASGTIEDDVAFTLPLRPVHTFSIVARDPDTGELGVAVQSHWFSVGGVVPWAEAGVGAVATQSFAEPAYGPRGLELMRSGMTAREALDALIAVDKGEAVRQVAFVDAHGRVAVHTGSKCIESAAHQTGKGFSVQANMMIDDTIVPAMARAFEKARGPLPERLLTALEAGQKAGGDIRGRQSAAILVVRGQSTGKVYEDRVVDLRVEDNDEPIKELRRLLTIHRAYEHMNAGDSALEKGNTSEAQKHYRAAARLAPNNVEMVYWHAVGLASNGNVKKSIPLFRKVFRADSNWIKLTRRLPKAGILSEEVAKRVVEQAGP